MAADVEQENVKTYQISWLAVSVLATQAGRVPRWTAVQHPLAWAQRLCAQRNLPLKLDQGIEARKMAWKLSPRLCMPGPGPVDSERTRWNR